MRSLFSRKEGGLSFWADPKGGERMRSVGFFRFVPVFSGLLVLAEVALISWRIVPMIYGQTAVPLHYNIHFGVDTIGEWWRIYTVPAVALGVLLINTGLTRYFFKRERALSYMASASTLLLQAILFVGTIFIILLNISYG